MAINDFLYGTPPQHQLIRTAGTQAPLAGFASNMGRYLSTLIGQPAPTYQGRLDPGLSPTMQALGQMLQGYAMRTPEVISGAQGGLPGGYMAAYRPPPMFDPGQWYQFAYRNPYGQQPGAQQGGAASMFTGTSGGFGGSGPGQQSGFPAFNGGASFNFGFQSPWFGGGGW